ncbi:hypothetical protein [Candidatus Deianiraea vastatrix]|uniref:DUF3168 domain-containing protein n=1 Tax=Candidatus Deianiraea vastatrix TaxID=2163644 RepID=A0A5B8XE32_9RICK|nr:hypothetical protein [Candidatus Deianiraea vastatrix]QED23490.1 hypothetical protein Deia_00699 [Candidatus Deianiraea vastatrix]
MDIFSIQKAFFQAINNKIYINNKKINIFSCIPPKNTNMPFTLINLVKISQDDGINSTAVVELSIVDDSQSIKNISDIINQIKSIISLDGINENIDSSFISCEIKSSQIENDQKYGFSTGILVYELIFQ